MSTLSHLDERSIKANGAHYTPPDLASFLADVTIRQATFDAKTTHVLDPACGDGSLLRAIAEAVPTKVRRRMKLIGYETDPTAAANAKANLSELDIACLDIRIGDFLDAIVEDYVHAAAEPLFTTSGATVERFDIVISNPPYVRTQVLGAKESQRLAALFGLSGRVDLYHAFVKAISFVLRPAGVLGLLTSNRFMLIQSGAAVRKLLRQDFELCDLYDLGDTKLFAAAVLPAILVARSDASAGASKCSFTRVYRIRNGGPKPDSLRRTLPSVLTALRQTQEGIVETAEGTFQIDRGELGYGSARRAPWSLSSENTREWLAKVHARRDRCFGDIAQVRVGIKTTADPVFIRDDWDELPERIRPEPELLRPLITHHTAACWLNESGPNSQKRVLYPHEEGPGGEKRAVNLTEYPRARAYLQQYRQKLESRRYVIEAGRKWYEIWVPQQPGDWSKDKVVYPDISEHPRFFLDTTGAVVNGDCYWITLNKGVDREWLYLLLAVANSTFITTYYDTVFHNKLYAGRRRFMTQYVREFPLPAKDGEESRKIIGRVSEAVDAKDPSALDSAVEGELDTLVWASFGLRKEAVR